MVAHIEESEKVWRRSPRFHTKSTKKEKNTKKRGRKGFCPLSYSEAHALISNNNSLFLPL
jgi:hypothetical protein